MLGRDHRTEPQVSRSHRSCFYASSPWLNSRRSLYVPLNVDASRPLCAHRPFADASATPQIDLRGPYRASMRGGKREKAVFG